MAANEKPVSANGVTGILIPVSFGFVFRVYGKDQTFVDYDIDHSDLQVTIKDDDAFFYKNKSGEQVIDHSPATLGLEQGKKKA